MTNIRSILLASAAVLGINTGTSVALAQEPAPAEPVAAPAADDGDPGEIIVTARKVDERLQDVPISVTAISGETLQELGATDVKDVLRMVPGLTFGGQDRGKSTYTIRGIASGLNTTGVYLDDVSVLNTGLEGGGGAPDPVFFDMARVEVLKGPQGTLYGGSAMGGAIKYVSAKPDLSEASGSGAIGTATTRHGALSYNAEGIINLPIVEGVLAFRGGLYFNREGGYIDNVANLDVENPSASSSPFPIYTPVLDPSQSQANKKDYNSANTYAARLSLLWQPDPSFSIEPSLFYQDYRLDNPSDYFPNHPGLVSSYRFTNQEQRDRFALYRLEARKRFRGVEFTSLTGYFDRKFVGDRDYSFFVNRIIGLPFETDSFANYGNTSKTFSQEFRLSSAANATGPLTWVVGLFYNDRNIRANPKVKTYSPIFPGMLLDSVVKTSISEYAIFGDASYEILDGLELNAGVRFFKIKQDSKQRTFGVISAPPTDLKSKEDGINPKLGIAYKVRKDNLLFASAAKGFRYGGPLGDTFIGCEADFPALGLDGPPTQYDSDNVWTYEVGSKNAFVNGRAIINAAIFQTNWKKIQQTIELPTCGSRFTANAGEARVRGAELETAFTLTRGLQLGGTASYLNAKITDPGEFGVTFAKGDELLSVPKWSTSLFASYVTPLRDDLELSFRVDYQYRSSARLTFNSVQGVRYSDGVEGTIPNSAERDPAYDIANANVSVGNDRTDVRLYVNNIFDESPRLDYNPLILLHSRASTLRPRTIGIELRQKF